MTRPQLPEFRYFQDPVGAGVFVESDEECMCCGKARGYLYHGPLYTSSDEMDEDLCPWCIADGSAAERFDATFVDDLGVGGYGDWEAVSDNVVEEVTRRTPCFTAWQQEQWWTHCGDAAIFVGYAGREELSQYGEQCIRNIRASGGLENDDDRWGDIFQHLQVGGSVMAYVFRCSHCGEYGGYWDCD